MSDKARDRDITVNRRAFHEYHFDERLEAGLALVGSEVKSLRDGRVNLKDAYARFFGDELFLVGVHISPYGPASQFGHDPERQRKLLLHRRELDRLAAQSAEKGLTLVPLRLYFKGPRAKVEIAVARGKDRFDKRQAIKERETRRDMDRALREANR
jgi:SsrA-binding protein